MSQKTVTTKPRKLVVSIICVGLLALASSSLEVETSSAQQSAAPTSNQGRQLSLRDQLINGLRAFTRSDIQFIDRVVAAVQQGRLPRRVVDGTFIWARDRAARRGYNRRLRPMVYFQPAMVARASRLRVAL